MNLVDKKVVHETFGRGSVADYDDSYVKVEFKSGPKRFVFPDAFGKYIRLVDQETAIWINEKIERKDEERKKEALRIAEEEALKREKLKIIREQNEIRNSKIHPSIQSVFWCETDEEEKIFTEWNVFTGKIASGKRKGEPRKLARMNQNSGCLITRRDSNMPEKNRRILGIFMADEGFNGRRCEEGYIPAHPKYRIRLTEEESEKMLFWNYYVNKRFPHRMTWNSGRQRYFDNIWMAQILRDMISLREGSEEEQEAEAFFDYFCNINRIKKDELPQAKGGLMQI